MVAIGISCISLPFDSLWIINIVSLHIKKPGLGMLSVVEYLLACARTQIPSLALKEKGETLVSI
jgi:hypothetical protein